MKGVVIAVTLVLLLSCSIALANPPLISPIQYEQFCEAQKVSGTGVVDVSTSIVDKKLALEYFNNMAGDGDFELDQEHAYSQNADKLLRNITSVNGGDKSQLNLYESTKLTYAGDTPLVGAKHMQSKEFYGGIGATIDENFAVFEMEKDQTAFFVSTAPTTRKWPDGSCEPGLSAASGTLLSRGILQVHGPGQSHHDSGGADQSPQGCRKGFRKGSPAYGQ